MEILFKGNGEGVYGVVGDSNGLQATIQGLPSLPVVCLEWKRKWKLLKYIGVTLGYIGIMLGCRMGYIGIMEKKMEITI